MLRCEHLEPLLARVLDEAVDRLLGLVPEHVDLVVDQLVEPVLDGALAQEAFGVQKLLAVVGFAAPREAGQLAVIVRRPVDASGAVSELGEVLLHRRR